MLATERLGLYVLAAGGLFVLQHVIVGFFRDTARATLWSKIDTVGPSKGPYPWLRGVLSSILTSRQYATEGYDKFCKALGRPYVLPTTWTDNASIVVVPPVQMHKMLTRLDKLPENEITNIPGLIQTVQLPYVIPDPEIYRNVIHFEVVRKKMSKRDMYRFAPMMAEEIDLAYKDIFGTSTEWQTINGWDACGQVISRTAERLTTGLPLCRDKDLLETSRKYATSILVGGAILNCFPPFLRGIVAPFISLRGKLYQARCVKLLLPTVHKRLQLFNEKKEGVEMPEDFLQWLIEISARGGPHQLEPKRVANRLTALMTPLIFAVCYVFSHTVIDLYGSPHRDEFLSGIEAECKAASEKYGGLATSEAIDSLHRTDSAIRESMRTSDVAVTNLFRDVTVGKLDLGNGITVTEGMRMAFPTQNIHLDPDHYEDPKTYDAFRFSRPFEGTVGKDLEREHIVTPTLSFLPLGYGRHACPGRWFAAQTMKQALSYLVMNYGVELVGPPPKRFAMVNTMVPPVDTQIRIRRKT